MLCTAAAGYGKPVRIDTGEITPGAATLVELLRRQAERYGDKVVFAYSDNGDEEGRIQLSYAELDRKARAIGATLQAAGAAGQRVLVFCRNGFEHIAGFFGCWYAGAVAVPVHEKFPPRLSWVIPDAEPAFAVTSVEMPMHIMVSVDGLVEMIGGQRLRWSLTDRGDPEAWVPPEQNPDATALLMYTSGTTAAPKAVVQTHRNILCNVAAMNQVSGDNDQTVGVSWMPHQHNMSLVSQLVAIINAGATGIGMSPDLFTQRPMRWLEMIAEIRATATGAPSWAYASCVEHSSAAERAALDLSCLVNAAGGAQSTSAADLRAFAEAFAEAGFRPEVFRAGYGLAEATSGVSGSMVSTVPVVACLNRTALADGRVVDVEPCDAEAIELVSSGVPLAGQLVVVVDPESRNECSAGELGEIWVAGYNVAQGYWRRPEETRQTFGGFLAGTEEGPFLRTGDLGFLRDGELFVAGRCRDLITIGGSNYYPDDIEATVQAAHPALLSGRGAVFAVPPKTGEEVLPDDLIVAQEVNLPRVDETELGEIAKVVESAISERHGIEMASMLLIAAGGLPSTAIGKVQRNRCRQLFDDRALETLAEWHAAQLPRGNPRDAREALLFNDLAAAQHRRQREGR